jgi:hypothetical protein
LTGSLFAQEHASAGARSSARSPVGTPRRDSLGAFDSRDNPCRRQAVVVVAVGFRTAALGATVDFSLGWIYSLRISRCAMASPPRSAGPAPSDRLFGCHRQSCPRVAWVRFGTSFGTSRIALARSRYVKEWWAGRGSARLAGGSSYGETRTRTGDTTIFREPPHRAFCARKTCKYIYSRCENAGRCRQFGLGRIWALRGRVEVLRSQAVPSH